MAAAAAEAEAEASNMDAEGDGEAPAPVKPPTDSDTMDDGDDARCAACLGPVRHAVFISDGCRHSMCLVCAETLRRLSWRLPSGPDAVSMCGEHGERLRCNLRFEGVCPLCRAPARAPGLPLVFVDPERAAQRADQAPECPHCGMHFRVPARLAAHVPRCEARMPPCPFCAQKLMQRARRSWEPHDALMQHILTDECAKQHCSQCHRVGTFLRIARCESQHRLLSEAIGTLRQLCATIPANEFNAFVPLGLAMRSVDENLATVGRLMFQHAPLPDSDEAREWRTVQAAAGVPVGDDEHVLAVGAGQPPALEQMMAVIRDFRQFVNGVGRNNGLPDPAGVWRAEQLAQPQPVRPVQSQPPASPDA